MSANATRFFYVQDNALEGERLARVEEFQFGKRIHLSPAMYSLWLGEDRPAFLKSLKVTLPDGREKPYMDLGGDEY